MSKSGLPFGGDVDIGWKLEVGATVTFVSATIVVTLRCLTRWNYSKTGWDDYIMVFALLQALVATIIDFVATHYGLGRHTFYLSPSQAVNQQYYSLLAQVFCVHALTFAKISIAVSYMRVIRGSGHRLHQVALWTISALVFIVNTLVIITFYVACSPSEKAWRPLTKGTCWTIKKRLVFVLLQGSFSAFSDFFLAFYPFLFLHKLQIKRSRKALVLGLMALGAVTGAFALVRTVESSNQLHPPPGAKPDVSFSSVLGLTWAGMERNIAILAGSIPALNPLASPTANFLKNTFSSSRSILRSSRSQSYQLSDNMKSRKPTTNEGSGFNQSTRSPQKSSVATRTTSEENILPTIHSVQSREDV